MGTTELYLEHEHDFVIHELLVHEKPSQHAQCITCDISYCLLCGKISNNEKECVRHNTGQDVE